MVVFSCLLTYVPASPPSPLEMSVIRAGTQVRLFTSPSAPARERRSAGTGERGQEPRSRSPRAGRVRMAAFRFFLKPVQVRCFLLESPNFQILYLLLSSEKKGNLCSSKLCFLL